MTARWSDTYQLWEGARGPAGPGPQPRDDFTAMFRPFTPRLLMQRPGAEVLVAISSLDYFIQGFCLSSLTLCAAPPFKAPPPHRRLPRVFIGANATAPSRCRAGARRVRLPKGAAV